MFSFSRFKYLERLLLVHGHWNYDRLARMVLYFFYKNAALVLVTFWFQLYNGFSSSIMFDAMYLMMFNMFWTSLPPLAIGKFSLEFAIFLILLKSIHFSNCVCTTFVWHKNVLLSQNLSTWQQPKVCWKYPTFCVKQRSCKQCFKYEWTL